jgi:hypothetical protein
MTEIIYIFFQNDFHLNFSSIRLSQISQDSEIAQARCANAAGHGDRHCFWLADGTQDCRRTSWAAAIARDDLVPCGKRQQGDVPGLLDGAGQAALVRGANAGEPPGHDFATLGDETLEQTYIAVRDRVDFLSAEFADLFAAEELAASAGPTGGTSAGAALRPTALARTGTRS